MEDIFIPCTIKRLPAHLHVQAAQQAIEINPMNAPRVLDTMRMIGLSIPAPGVLSPEHLAILTGKWWGTKGVTLTVGFPFDNPPVDLKNRILQHMNAWSAYANVHFVITMGAAQVRIARVEGDGYWSYVGVDVLSIPKDQPTMNLEAFTMQTSESEYHRVVRHETGHTLGSPHEHMRSELVNRLDVEKTVAYFLATQGWSREETMQQVLTPLSQASIRGTPHADQDSCMCYQLPSSITKDGKPIRGGIDIDLLDAQFISKIYPKHH